MIRKLLIVSATGLAVAILALGTGWVVGGDKLSAQLRDQGLSWTFDDDDDGPRTTRVYDFDGNRILVIDAPVDLRYNRGAAAKMQVSVPSRVADRLIWSGDTLSFGHGVHNAGMKVTITSPQLAGLRVNSAGDVHLKGLDQPALAIEANGAIDLDGSGKVHKVSVVSNGAGDVDLAALDARDASVEINGVGSVDLNASGRVDADVSGAGDVTLHRKPAELHTTINGAGSIDHRY